MYQDFDLRKFINLVVFIKNLQKFILLICNLHHIRLLLNKKLQIGYSKIILMYINEPLYLHAESKLKKQIIFCLYM